MNTGWNHSESPFHQGEQDVQARYGVKEKMESFGRRIIRDYLPEQHRQFYQQLPFLLLGSSDEQGRPWVSIVVGRQGFISSPTTQQLRLDTQPLFGSPLASTLKVGTPVGVLGILPESRRRNRLTGRIGHMDSKGFDLDIAQTFGNCPQYIQKRTIEVLPDIDTPSFEQPKTRSDRFDTKASNLIETADTLFIATIYAENSEALSQGADVSHRGGKPGFIKVEDERTFIFPDFQGNFHFNTVGNLILNPKAGFLFIDFEQRDLLYLTGEAEIVWEGEDLKQFVGAERLIRFHLTELIRVEQSLPIQFTFGEYSPTLEQTGSWEQVRVLKRRAIQR